MLEDLNAEHDLEAELFVIIMITIIKRWWVVVNKGFLRILYQ